MKVEKKDLEKSQIELTVELSVEEFQPHIERGAEKVSREVKIDGFRPGKVPFDVLKKKIGEMTILEEAGNLAINKTLGQVISENSQRQAVGQPQVSITKLAPGNSFEYKVIFSVLPEIKLGDYKNVKTKTKKVEVSDEEVEKVIEQLKEAQVKEVLVEREVKENDKALVDIEIFLDKVPVENGQAKGVAIVVGKNYIVPGFDKNIIGAKKGEARDFSLPYPDDYHMAHLAGKRAEFKVKVGDVYEREYPEVNDDFAKNFGLKNAEELHKNIKTSLNNEKQQKEDQRVEIEIMDKIISQTKFGDLPELLINSEIKTMIAELEQSVVSQGGKFEDYLSSIKKTRDQLSLDFSPDAVKRVKSALIIREISEIEKIEASSKEVEEKIDELLKQYKGYEKVEARIKEPGYANYLKNIISNKKVVEKLREWNLEK